MAPGLPARLLPADVDNRRVRTPVGQSGRHRSGHRCQLPDGRVRPEEPGLPRRDPPQGPVAPWTPRAARHARAVRVGAPGPHPGAQAGPGPPVVPGGLRNVRSSDVHRLERVRPVALRVRAPGSGLPAGRTIDLATLEPADTLIALESQLDALAGLCNTTRPHRSSLDRVTPQSPTSDSPTPSLGPPSARADNASNVAESTQAASSPFATTHDSTTSASDEPTADPPPATR